MAKVIEAADLFCGAGGTSTGLIQAIQELGMNVRLTAINHWDIAVSTHAANHPHVNHLCETLDMVDPRKLFPRGRLHLLVASPECTHHSIARGGVPCSDQSRATAWHIVRWASSIYIDQILIENVPEIVSWCPLGADGRPLKSKKGQTFIAFVNALQSLGYRCEYRILNTANYGDATSRKRFFMICSRGNKRIDWPVATHSQSGGADLFNITQPWVPARNIIDWTIPGKSIFTRSKPLSENTLARIEAGLRRYGGKDFLVKFFGTSKTADISEPCPTVTASGQHIGLCSPSLHPGAGCPKQMATRPFIIPQQAVYDDDLRIKSIEDPLPTITTDKSEALVYPFVTIMKGKSTTRAIEAPLPTITTQPHLYLSYLVKYYGTGGARPVTEPLDTITTKDRYGLVEAIRNTEEADILFRMLQPHELAAAHSFPSDYAFKGNKSEIIKQIGNSVPVNTAKALFKAILKDQQMRIAA